MFEQMGVGCVVVLGGDGTSRAAAKGIDSVPLLSVSTGTNNVYPTLMEGTVAGMAAASAALMPEPYACCIRDKRIEVRVNGRLRDIALIDAVVSDDYFAGARAIWDAYGENVAAYDEKVSRMHREARRIAQENLLRDLDSKNI